MDTAILGAEVFDSDVDPFSLSNLAEITLGDQPGWTAGPHNSYY